MKDEIALKAEYKEIFAKIYAPEELRRKVGRLSTGDIQKKSTSFIKKMAIAAAVVIILKVLPGSYDAHIGRFLLIASIL